MNIHVLLWNLTFVPSSLSVLSSGLFNDPRPFLTIFFPWNSKNVSHGLIVSHSATYSGIYWQNIMNNFAFRRCLWINLKSHFWLRSLLSAVKCTHIYYLWFMMTGQVPAEAQPQLLCSSSEERGEESVFNEGNGFIMFVLGYLAHGRCQPAHHGHVALAGLQRMSKPTQSWVNGQKAPLNPDWMLHSVQNENLTSPETCPSPTGRRGGGGVVRGSYINLSFHSSQLHKGTGVTQCWWMDCHTLCSRWTDPICFHSAGLCEWLMSTCHCGIHDACNWGQKFIIYNSLAKWIPQFIQSCSGIIRAFSHFWPLTPPYWSQAEALLLVALLESLTVDLLVKYSLRRLSKQSFRHLTLDLMPKRNSERSTSS